MNLCDIYMYLICRYIYTNIYVLDLTDWVPSTSMFSNTWTTAGFNHLIFLVWQTLPMLRFKKSCSSDKTRIPCHPICCCSFFFDVVPRNVQKKLIATVVSMIFETVRAPRVSGSWIFAVLFKAGEILVNPVVYQYVFEEAPAPSLGFHVGFEGMGFFFPCGVWRTKDTWPGLVGFYERISCPPNIDTQNCHIWKEIHFPDRYVWYLC